MTCAFQLNATYPGRTRLRHTEGNAYNASNEAQHVSKPLFFVAQNSIGFILMEEMDRENR